MWETHKCCECDREHDASLWYRIEDYGFPKYLCGEKGDSPFDTVALRVLPSQKI